MDYRKLAIISGAFGQDSSYLAELLLEKDYIVVGFARRVSNRDDSNVRHLLTNPDFILEYGDVTDLSSIMSLIKKYNPNEFYNLAAMSFVGSSWAEPIVTQEVNYKGVINCLEAIRILKPDCRFYQASSSVTGDTKVIIRKNKTDVIVDKIENIIDGDTDSKIDLGDIECLSIDEDYKLGWFKINYGFKHYADNLYNIKGHGGLDLTLTGDHSVIVMNKDGDLVDKRVDELNNSDFLLSPIGDLVNEDSEYQEFDLSCYGQYPYNSLVEDVDSLVIDPDICRLIGYYMAEGNVFLKENSSYSITFTFHIDEVFYTEDIKDILLNIGVETFSEGEYPDKNTRKLFVSQKQLSQFLVEHFNTGSLKKKFPSWFFNLNKECFIEFLRGYIGDAHVSLDNLNYARTIRYTSGNQDLIETLMYLFKIHNMDGRLVKRFNKERHVLGGKAIEAGYCYDLDVSGIFLDQIAKTNFNNKNSLRCTAECLSDDIRKEFFGIKSGKKKVSKAKLLSNLEHRINKNLFIKDIDKLIKLCNSDLHVVRINSITKLDDSQMVYDFNVDQVQRFIGGNYPVLLHNSEIYGDVKTSIQNEDTSANPQSPYAASKYAAESLVTTYKDSYGLFACYARIFNHESPRRGVEFVTRKITDWIGRSWNIVDKNIGNWTDGSKFVPTEDAFKFAIEGKYIEPLSLGNIYAKRDWSHSKDVVKGMWMMLQADFPKNYVMASGKCYSVEDFLAAAFNEIGITNWQQFIKIDQKLYRPADVNLLCGDASKIKQDLGWEPTISFEELVKEMVQHDIKING